MLRKERLRVSRAGGDYQPVFVGGDPDAQRLAARVLGTYQGHVGEPRRALDAALRELEEGVGDGEGPTGGADAYKLVRGLADLLERDATFETRAPLPPERARRAAFTAAESIGVTNEESRGRALRLAADRLGTDAAAVEASLYADREPEQTLVSVDARWEPASLCAQYDLSLAATALFDAREVRVRSSDPKTLVSTAKRNGLLYEIELPENESSGTAGGEHETGDDGERTGDTVSNREVILTGPDALFRRTRRYGTAFAATLRTLARSVGRWELEATIDDRGTDRTMRLTDADVSAPDTEPVADVGFDSAVERDFARRFEALDLDWTLRREPEPLRVTIDGERRAMIPDFAFDYDHADFRVYLEVMGFWTPEYVTKKLAQLAGVEDVELIVAVDDSLGVGEEIETRDHRVIRYDRTVRVKPVVDLLREYESRLAARVTDELPAELLPPEDVIGLDAVADRQGVPTDALDEVAFPDHDRVGGVLVRPSVLAAVERELEPGLSYETAESILADHGITDTSAVFSELGYRVEWTGLSGGTLQREE